MRSQLEPARSTAPSTSPPRGETYALKTDEELATIIGVRPRLAPAEKHILAERRGDLRLPRRLRPVPGQRRIASTEMEKGLAESHLEARLWNDASRHTAAPSGPRVHRDLPVRDGGDPLRAGKGTNAGRWDFLFSVIKTFRTRGKEFLLPDRNAVTHCAPTPSCSCARAKRGAHAIGGMAAFILRDEAVDEDSPRSATTRPARPTASTAPGWHTRGWSRCARRSSPRCSATGQPDRQQARGRPRHRRPAPRRLRHPGEVTEAGLRNNVSVGIQYLKAWLGGLGGGDLQPHGGNVDRHRDRAAQVWQWLHNDVTLADTGHRVTRELVERIADEEIAKLPGDPATTRRRGRPSSRSPSPTSTPTSSRSTTYQRRVLTRAGGPAPRGPGRRRQRGGCRRVPALNVTDTFIAALGHEQVLSASAAANLRVRRPRRKVVPGLVVLAGTPTTSRPPSPAGAVRGPRLGHRPVPAAPCPGRGRARRHVADAQTARSTRPTSAPSSTRGIDLALTRATTPRTAAPRPGSLQPPCAPSAAVASPPAARGLKYGFAANHVVGLDLVSPAGERVEIGGKALDPPGYDLLGALVAPRARWASSPG